MLVGWPLWALVLLAYVVVQRLGELVYASANTRRLLAEGGIEHGEGHYPLFILLHSAWLAAIVLFGAPGLSPNGWLLGAFVVVQALRYWTLASIGRWWTTRIISAPHFPRVARGPYRWVRHPNYLVVIAEIALLPLMLGTWEVALIFSALNAALLWWRIRAENAALAERTGA